MIRGGIKLGGHNDHLFFGERFAEGTQLTGNDFEGMHWIGVARVAGLDEMNQKTCAFDVAEKSNSEAGSQMRAFAQTWKIGDDKGAAELRTVRTGAAVGVDDTEIGLEGGERIIGNLRARGRNDRDKCGFPRVGKTDEADVGKELELEAKMTLLADMAFFVFARSLVPGLGEMLVAASATTTLNDENALAGGGKVSDDLSRLVVEHESADGNLQNHVPTGMAAAVRAFPVAAPVGLEFAVVTVAQERIVLRIGFEIDAATAASVSA